MAFEGYLELGGSEVINSARTVGYTTTADCGAGWLRCGPCDGVRDVLGHDAYTYDNVEDAPWYDPDDPNTARFLGVHGLSMENLTDSTREAEVTEGIGDGGSVGQVRAATRRIRVRAALTAQGEDALELGLSWLKSALTGGHCGVHGDACGASDLRFFTACPPEESEITKPDQIWNTPVTNLATNPSMETVGAPVAVRTNLATNPSFEATTAATVEVRRNHAYNPSFEIDATNWGFVNGGTSTLVRSLARTHDGLASGLYTFGPSTVADSGPSPTHGMGTIQPGAVVTVSAWVYQPALVAGGLLIGAYGPAAGGTLRGTAKTGVATWERISLTFTAVAAGTFSVFIGTSLGGATEGAQYFVDSMLIENSSTVGTYFDGSLVPRNDLTHSWTSTAHGSASVGLGTAVPSTAAGNGGMPVASTEWAPSGSKSMRIIPTRTDTSQSYAEMIASTPVASLKVSTVYTIMAKARLTAPQTGPLDADARTLFVHLNGTMLVDHNTPGAQAPNVAGVHSLRATFTTPATLAGYNTIRLMNGARAGGGDVWWDDYLLVEGNYTGPYFDGSTPAKVRRNLARNPSFDAAGMNAWNRGPAFSFTSEVVPDAVAGGTVVRMVRNTTAPGNGYFAQVFPVEPGDYTMSFYIRRTAGNPVWRSVVGSDSGSEFTGSNVVYFTLPALGEWMRVVHTVTVTVKGGLLFIPNDDGDSAPAVGNTVEVDAVLFERSSTAGAYFDGVTPIAPYAAAWEGVPENSASYLYDPDFTYGWTGTPNASTSAQYAEPVVSATTTVANGIAMSSQQWSSNRSRSLRVVAVAGNADTYASIGGDNGALRMGMQAGKTYTASATIHIKTPQTGTLDTRARTIMVHHGVGATLVKVQSTAAPNAPGTYQLSLTFTLGPTDNVAFIRLYNGSGVAGENVWWDDFMLVEGQSSRTYFDGSFPDSTPDELATPGASVVQYDWTGTADASTSTLTTGSVISVPDPIGYELTVERLIRYMHAVTCVAGPTIEEKLHRNDVWGYVVEFVLVAAVPWMFSVTKSVNIEPSSPVVIQDTPFNLVPYPSAELTEYTELAANPCLVVDATGWNGTIAAVSGSAPGSLWTVGRSTLTEGLHDECPASFRGYLKALATGSDVTGVARGTLYYDVDVATVATNDLVALSTWGKFGAMTGESSDAQKMRGYATWMTAANAPVGSVIELGQSTVSSAMHAGLVFGATATKPATATKVRIAIDYDFLWNGGANNGAPSTIPVYMSSAQGRTGGYVIASTNYVLNPSVEVNATGWSAGSSVITPTATGARSTEVWASGTASYKVSAVTTNAGTAGSMWAIQNVALPAYVAGQRFSFSAWLNASQGGTAVITGTRFRIEWKNASNVIVSGGNVTIGTGAATGATISGKAIARPADATQVTLVMILDLASWSIGASLALYVDAVAVTVP